MVHCDERIVVAVGLDMKRVILASLANFIHIVMRLADNGYSENGFQETA